VDRQTDSQTDTDVLITILPTAPLGKVNVSKHSKYMHLLCYNHAPGLHTGELYLG